MILYTLSRLSLHQLITPYHLYSVPVFKLKTCHCGTPFYLFERYCTNVHLILNLYRDTLPIFSSPSFSFSSSYSLQLLSSSTVFHLLLHFSCHVTIFESAVPQYLSSQDSLPEWGG
uniref:Uncharacterized protein n=1 Tax=Cacopsylla melanoneura TaxID=428564 RepID=A0A8D8U4U4_9HEMI